MSDSDQSSGNGKEPMRWASRDNARDGGHQHLKTTIPKELAGLRLDQALANLFPDYSRSRIQLWIRSGDAIVEARRWRPSDRIQGGEQVELCVEPPQDKAWDGEPLSVDILYEDDELIVVNKPSGMVVHPGAGNRNGTLVNALLYHDPGLASVPRAGLVHRIDKDTTGVLVVARNLRAHKRLVDQLKTHTMRRDYEALVAGTMTAGGSVNAPVGRHRVHRTRMAVVASGKPAVTQYRVTRRFQAHTHIHLALETGRTHQIRVHMAYIGHPVFGDPVYGGRLRLPAAADPRTEDALRRFKRQALHATRLTLQHPGHGETLNFAAPLPRDMAQLLVVLDAAERRL